MLFFTLVLLYIKSLNSEKELKRFLKFIPQLISSQNG